MQDDINITIAVISAVSAISGSLIAQLIALLTGHLSKKHSRNILLREKYEELADHITDSHSWVTQVMALHSISQLQDQQLPVHARKAMSLAHIYFPQLREACQDYLNSCVLLQMELINSYGYKDGATLAAQAIFKNKGSFLKSANSVSECRHIIDDAIIKYSKTYAKA